MLNRLRETAKNDNSLQLCMGDWLACSLRVSISLNVYLSADKVNCYKIITLSVLVHKRLDSLSSQHYLHL